MENKDKYIDVKINEEIYEILKLWNKERKEDLKNLNNQCTRNPIYKVQKNTWTTATSEDFEKEKKFVEWQIKSLEAEKQRAIEKNKDFKGEIYDMEIKYNKVLLEVIKIQIEYIKKYGVVRK